MIPNKSYTYLLNEQQKTTKEQENQEQSFARNLSNKYKKKFFDTGLDALKTDSKKVVHRTGELLGNKLGDTSKLNDNKTVKTVEKIIVPPEKREEILNVASIKMEHQKIKVFKKFNCVRICTKTLHGSK